jgi:hypothetical protein
MRLLHELEEISTREYVAPSDFAYIWMALGEKDKAFELFTKACEARDDRMLTVKVDPDLDPLRTDPRFGKLLKCVHLE